MAPCAVALGMAFLEPTYQLNWILEWVNMLSTTQTNVNDKMYEILILIKGIVVLMIFISIGGIFYGGSAVAVILNREILEQLLAPPKSVQRTPLSLNMKDNPELRGSIFQTSKSVSRDSDGALIYKD